MGADSWLKGDPGILALAEGVEGNVQGKPEAESCEVSDLCDPAVGKFGGEKRLSSLVYAEDQSNFKTRSLHHLRRPQAPSRIAKGASP